LLRPLKTLNNLIKHSLQPLILLLARLQSNRNQSSPAPSLNGTKVKMVLKCIGFNCLVNAPDPLPASTGTTGVEV
jgi:hypothetical protein